MVYNFNSTASRATFYYDINGLEGDYELHIASKKVKPRIETFFVGDLVKIIRANHDHLIGKMGRIKFVRGCDFTIRFFDKSEWTYFNCSRPYPFERIKFAWRKL